MLTDECVLAAYADGSDLDDVAPQIRERLGRFIGAGQWPTSQILLVDHRHPPDPEAPDYLPQWDLGVNLGLDHRPISPAWFAAVESLVHELRLLHAETGREFVLFVCFRSRPWLQEHLSFVSAGPLDCRWLQAAIERLADSHT